MRLKDRNLRALRIGDSARPITILTARPQLRNRMHDRFV
jgi:hypothetical protein